MKNKEELLRKREDIKRKYLSKKDNGTPDQNLAEILLEYYENDEEITKLENPNDQETQQRLKINKVEELKSKKDTATLLSIFTTFFTSAFSIFFVEELINSLVFKSKTSNPLTWALMDIPAILAMVSSISTRIDLKKELDEAIKDLDEFKEEEKKGL